ncbi:hypothetical protein GcC1_222001 [Golovinomyces cichoracearum]|uniref:Ubiquitin-like domain-containing protein n=1 Tax=Golovinomyces cichoracearum TaxID=62708 RepID=A0A420H775_9PEZI|nr:hypothetical protein GcC1_222001 [Golovinomyces cichoracearum]
MRANPVSNTTTTTINSQSYSQHTTTDNEGLQSSNFYQTQSQKYSHPSAQISYSNGGHWDRADSQDTVPRSPRSMEIDDTTFAPPLIEPRTKTRSKTQAIPLKYRPLASTRENLPPVTAPVVSVEPIIDPAMPYDHTYKGVQQAPSYNYQGQYNNYPSQNAYAPPTARGYQAQYEAGDPAYYSQSTNPQQSYPAHRQISAAPERNTAQYYNYYHTNPHQEAQEMIPYAPSHPAYDRNPTLGIAPVAPQKRLGPPWRGNEMILSPDSELQKELDKAKKEVEAARKQLDDRQREEEEARAAKEAIKKAEEEKQKQARAIRELIERTKREVAEAAAKEEQEKQERLKLAEQLRQEAEAKFEKERQEKEEREKAEQQRLKEQREQIEKELLEAAAAKKKAEEEKARKIAEEEAAREAKTKLDIQQALADAEAARKQAEEDKIKAKEKEERERKELQQKIEFERNVAAQKARDLYIKEQMEAQRKAAQEAEEAQKRADAEAKEEQRQAAIKAEIELLKKNAAEEKAKFEEEASLIRKKAEETAEKARLEAAEATEKLKKEAEEVAAQLKKEAEEVAAQLKKEKEEVAEQLKKEKEEALAKAMAPPPPDDKKKTIKFKDAVGRTYQFPFHLCSTRAGIHELIKQAFANVPLVGPQVSAEQYELLDSNGEIIIPQAWESTIEPDQSITMRLWKIDKPEPKPSTPPPPPPPPPPPAPAPAPAPAPVVNTQPPKTRKRNVEPRGPSVLGWMAGRRGRPPVRGSR